MTTNAPTERRPQPLYLDGAELKRRREAVPGLSQTALAAAAGTTQSHVAHWEAGDYGCGIKVIKKLAAALPECEPTDLMHAGGKAAYEDLLREIAA